MIKDYVEKNLSRIIGTLLKKRVKSWPCLFCVYSVIFCPFSSGQWRHKLRKAGTNRIKKPTGRPALSWGGAWLFDGGVKEKDNA